ncbi:MAG: hypothetical protein ACRD9S_05215 [Pyrinomonadaceae bacterium]
MRDVGNEGNFACSSLSRGITQGLVPGPTIINAGRIIAPYGGQFHLQPDKPNLAEPEYFFAEKQNQRGQTCDSAILVFFLRTCSI